MWHHPMPLGLKEREKKRKTAEKESKYERRDRALMV
jgi:hypothetical protein